MKNVELTELMKDLKILTICINELTELMNVRENTDKKFIALYNERLEYLNEQNELNIKINSIINPKK